MKNQPEEGPDQGWSWVVAFAACSVSLILAGICRTFGVLLVSIISEYHTTRAEASWPFILNFAVFNLIGIVGGPLGHRFGVRPVIILGSLISTVGFAACYFATSLIFITISIGIIFGKYILIIYLRGLMCLESAINGGIGCGLFFTLMPAIVNQYFLKFRATASGIANSGSCFGSVILPHVYEYLTFNFGLKGCFLLTGGIVLQTAISGVLMRPPSWIKKSKTKQVAVLKILGMTCSNVNRIPSLSTKSGNDDMEKTSENNVSYIVREYDSVNAGAAPRQGGNLYHFDEKNNCFNSIKKNQMNNVPTVVMDSGSGVKRQFKEQNISENSNVFIQYENKLNTESEHSSAYETKLQDNAQELNCTVGNEQKTSLKTESQGTVKENSKTHEVASSSDHVICSYVTEIAAISEHFENVNCNTEQEEPNTQIMKSKLLPNTNIKTLKEESVDSICNFTTNKSVIDSISEFKTETQRHGINIGSSETALQPGNLDVRNHPNASNDKYETHVVKRQHLLNNEIPVLHVDNFKNVSDAVRNSEHRSDVPLGIMQSFSHVMKSPMFHITAITNVCFFFLYHIYIVIIIDFLIDRGISHEKSNHILYTFAFSDLMGRLCFGWITDREFLRRSQLVMICMILMGLVFICYPFVYGYEQQIIISCVYGVLLGCTLVIFPVLLVDYVGIEFIEIAHGYVCFLNGVGTLIWPFVIGYFRDNLGSYSNMFYVLGAISLIASLLWLLEKCFIKIYNISDLFQTE